MHFPLVPQNPPYPLLLPIPQNPTTKPLHEVQVLRAAPVSSQAARGKEAQEPAEAEPLPPDVDALERHLTEYSYVLGHQPCQTDAKVLARLPGAPDTNTHPAVTRWVAHMRSYTPQELKDLPDPQGLQFRVPLVREGGWGCRAGESSVAEDREAR